MVLAIAIMAIWVGASVPVSLVVGAILGRDDHPGGPSISGPVRTPPHLAMLRSPDAA